MYRRDRHFGSKTLVGTLLALALCAAGARVAYAAGKPALGVVIEGVPYTQLQNKGLTHGVAVRGLVSGSPAEQSGIRPGDIIVNINQQPVYSPDQLQWLVGHLEPNQKARITYVHQGQQKTTTIEPVAAVAGGQTPSQQQEQAQQQAGAAPSGQATGQGPSGQQGAQQGQSGQSYLGIAMQPMTEDLANALGSPTGNGVLIAKVQKGGSAAQAGVRAGDILLGIGNQEIQNPADVYQALENHQPGQQVQLRIVRNKNSQQVPVQLGSNPEGQGQNRLGGMPWGGQWPHGFWEQGPQSSQNRGFGADFDQFIRHWQECLQDWNQMSQSEPGSRGYNL
jgi:membrane-associated protease RseP (regulator of RpoE activity)